MRVDKFLKVNRIIKRRVMAKEAIAKGFVKKNGRPTKPGAEIAVNDIIEVAFSNRILKVKVSENFQAEIIEETKK